jgi:hypothetical protein
VANQYTYCKITRCIYRSMSSTGISDGYHLLAPTSSTDPESQPELAATHVDSTRLLLPLGGLCSLMMIIKWTTERKFVAYSVSPTLHLQLPLPYKTMHRLQKRRPNLVDATSVVVASRARW